MKNHFIRWINFLQTYIKFKEVIISIKNFDNNTFSKAFLGSIIIIEILKTLQVMVNDQWLSQVRLLYSLVIQDNRPCKRYNPKSSIAPFHMKTHPRM